jgi:hypothetical protein
MEINLDYSSTIQVRSSRIHSKDREGTGAKAKIRQDRIFPFYLGIRLKDFARI